MSKCQNGFKVEDFGMYIVRYDPWMEREGDAFMSFRAFLDALRGFGGYDVLASGGEGERWGVNGAKRVNKGLLIKFSDVD